MSKFIYTILFSVFLFSTVGTQSHADSLQECRLKCSPSDTCKQHARPGDCEACMQVCNKNFYAKVDTSKNLEECTHVCSPSGTCDPKHEQCNHCLAMCKKLHTAPMGTVTPKTAPMGNITRVAPTGPILEHSCASICEFGRTGDIYRGKGDCNYLTYDNELLNECYGILNKPNCFELCKNKICINPKITRPNGDESLKMKGEGSIHCAK